MVWIYKIQRRNYVSHPIYSPSSIYFCTHRHINSNICSFISCFASLWHDGLYIYSYTLLETKVLLYTQILLCIIRDLFLFMLYFLCFIHTVFLAFLLVTKKKEFFPFQCVYNKNT